MHANLFQIQPKSVAAVNIAGAWYDVEAATFEVGSAIISNDPKGKYLPWPDAFGFIEASTRAVIQGPLSSIVAFRIAD